MIISLAGICIKHQIAGCLRELFMKVEKTLSFVFSRVSTAYRNSLERSMGQVGLHSGQVFILLQLWRHDGLKQVDLASRLGVSTPTINKMVLGLSKFRPRRTDQAGKRRSVNSDLSYRHRINNKAISRSPMARTRREHGCGPDRG